MSNTYFRFKQFRIEQDKCAMKVTTDACIQGAWTPIQQSVKKVLDIGAGTGLLSLMLAQRNKDIHIDAVEIDVAAAVQAMDNVAASVWKERVQVVESDIRNYTPRYKYDLIITNPPFFNNSLLSDKASVNAARHTLSLPYEELQEAIAHLLDDVGYYSVLLPYTEYQLWKDMQVKQGWHECGKLSICHRPGADVKRVVGMFCKKLAIHSQEGTLIIKETDGQYSDAFKKLLAPFYLEL